MRVPQLRLAALALVSGMGLSGCASDMYGSPYGYGGVDYGYNYGYPGYGYGYSPNYGSGYGYGYGYGYGAYDPFGWYGDFYYPGVGIYVYDRHRNRHVWNNDQQRYWADRRSQWQGRGGTVNNTENWSGWNHQRQNRSNWQGRPSNEQNNPPPRRWQGQGETPQRQ